ncbi:MAG: tetratricopeptide repeat protein [Verrucomicrobiota bacterium]
MKILGKALAYLLLIVVATFCFVRMRSAYVDVDVRGRQMARADGEEAASRPEAAEAEVETAPSGPAAPPPAGATNTPAPGVASGGDTHRAALTNGAPPASTHGPARAAGRPGGAARAGAPGAGGSRAGAAGLYLSGFVFSLMVLAILGGWDLTQALAGRATRAVGADLEGTPGNDPEYDAAEEEWTKGNYLEAIGQMREYLQRHPSEQYVAIRIAEIYEKDLQNYLAAALELEEVLTRKLPREKWGWTAVHLSNLYSGRLNQPDKAMAVLNRILADYPDTAAAQKTRRRLGLPEPATAGAAVAEAAAAEAEAGEPGPSPDEGGLPRGFRARKR